MKRTFILLGIFLLSSAIQTNFVFAAKKGRPAVPILSENEASEYLVSRFAHFAIQIKRGSVSVEPSGFEAYFRVCSERAGVCDLVKRSKGGTLVSKFDELAAEIGKVIVVFRHFSSDYRVADDGSFTDQTINISGDQDGQWGILVDEPTVVADVLRNILFYSRQTIPFLKITSKRGILHPGFLPKSNSNQELEFKALRNSGIALSGFSNQSPEVMDGFISTLIQLSTQPTRFAKIPFVKKGVLVMAPWSMLADAALLPSRDESQCEALLLNRLQNPWNIPQGPFLQRVTYEKEGVSPK